MSVYYKINNLLENVLGARIAKMNKPSSLLRFIPSKPLYIEFVRASAVGKTTLYNEFFKLCPKNFIPVDEFIRGYKKEFLKLSPTLIPKQSLYQKIAAIETKLVSKFEEYLGTAKLFRNRLLYDFLKFDDAVKKFNTDSIVINDNGFIHGFNDSLIELENTNKDSLLNLICNRIITYRQANPEVIALGIKKREMESGFSPVHKGKTVEKLNELQQRLVDAGDRLIRRLRKWNTPVLHINTMESISDNCHKIKLFMNNTQKSIQ